MDKELPSIFKVECNKKIENNKKVFYSKYHSLNKEENDIRNVTEARNYADSLDDLLKNNEFIFNVPVEINLKNEVISAKLVSKVGDHLLTNTGKTIKLEDILFIRIKEV